MNTKIKHIMAMTMAVLMTVVAFGTVTVGATGNFYDPEEDPCYASYFADCKDWGQVWAYTWMENDIIDPVTKEVIGKEITELAPFPGVEFTKAGTTTCIDKVEYPDSTEQDIYEYNSAADKKVWENGGYDRGFVIFNQGTEHGQQTSAIHVGKFYGGITLVSLDKDNNAMEAHFISPEYIHLFDEKKKG